MQPMRPVAAGERFAIFVLNSDSAASLSRACIARATCQLSLGASPTFESSATNAVANEDAWIREGSADRFADHLAAWADAGALTRPVPGSSNADLLFADAVMAPPVPTEIEDPLPHTFGSFIGLLGSDAWNTLIAPLRWRTRGWTLFGLGAAAIVVTSIYIDKPADRFNRESHRTGPLRFWTHVSDWGIAIPYIAIGAHGLYGYLWDQDHAKRVFLDGVEAVAIVSALLLTFKIAIGRSLPDKRSRALQFKPFHNGWDTAFPSGHTVQAFIGATILTASYLDYPWVGVSAITVAGAVAYSRLYLHEHWVTDVVAGAILAGAVGWEIYSLHRHTLTSSPETNTIPACFLPARIGLWQQPGESGLRLDWEF